MNLDTKVQTSFTVTNATAGSYSASVEDAAPSVNYQAVLTLSRKTFTKTGMSSYFKVVPAGSPTVTFGSALGSQPYVLGQTLDVAFTLSSMAALSGVAAPTAKVELWISTLGGSHNPKGDAKVADLANATISASGGGSVAVTLPSDALLATSSYYFFAVTSNDVTYIAAASPYVTIGPPTLTLTGVDGTPVCGGGLSVSWAGSGLTNPASTLTFDIYTFDAAARANVFFARLASGVNPSFSTLSNTLPAQMPTGTYMLYAYNGANFSTSMAKSVSPSAVIACPKVITVASPASFTAGDQVTITYTTSGIPQGAALAITLEAAGEAPIVLAADARNVGYFIWASDPTLTFSGRKLRIATADDSTAFGVTAPFDATAPAAQISVGTAPSTTWTAGKAVRVTWTSTGLNKTADMCFVEIWALPSSYIGASWAANVTGLGGVNETGTTDPKYPNGILCSAKGGIEWTPPATLSTATKYFAFSAYNGAQPYHARPNALP